MCLIHFADRNFLYFFCALNSFAWFSLRNFLSDSHKILCWQSLPPTIDCASVADRSHATDSHSKTIIAGFSLVLNLLTPTEKENFSRFSLASIWGRNFEAFGVHFHFFLCSKDCLTAYCKNICIQCFLTQAQEVKQESDQTPDSIVSYLVRIWWLRGATLGTLWHERIHPWK